MPIILRVGTGDNDDSSPIVSIDAKEWSSFDESDEDAPRGTNLPSGCLVGSRWRMSFRFGR